MQEIAKDLLSAAAKGDIKAFEKIYKISSGFVYSVAYRVTNSSDSAEDVTQEVFLKIYNNLKDFKFRSSFKTWIYRITVNTSINAYRKKTKDLTRKADYDKALRYVPAPGGVEEAVDRNEDKEQIKSLLAKLNPGQRACIILREIEDLSYKEIAAALKININTLRSRLKRARQALL
jgi:RNA polymerase sigma-70 factor (ECF subfamily)